MNKSLKIAIACSGILSLNMTAFAQIQTSFEDTYFVNVTYSNEEVFSKATIQVLDENKEYPIYAGESKNITYAQEDGYTVNFRRFKLSNRLHDGVYKIKVGANGTTEEITFDFVNIPAKIQAMQRLKDAQNESEFMTCIEEDYMFLGIDITKLNELGDYKTRFLSALFADLEFDDQTITADNLEEQKAVLIAGIDKQFEVLSLMNAKNNLPEVVDNLQIISVDKTWYDKLSDKTELIRIYSSYNEKSEQISLDDILKAFDGACLCVVINTCDYKTAEEALSYYSDKEVIKKPDMSYYDKLSDLNKSNVFQKLAKKNISDYNTIEEAFESIAKIVYDQVQKENNKSGGSSGGGGGRGSSAGIIIVPKNDEDSIAEENEKKETSAGTDKKTFPDIDGVSWAVEAINSLADEGCISGDENGCFNPDNKITREEFVKMVVLAFGKYDYAASADFSDVEKKAWYFPYIASGIKSGFVNGISDNKFGIGLNITRQDAAVILSRIYNKNHSRDVGMNFKDNDKIADYAQQAVSQLSFSGVINGMDDGNFYPENSLTRAEAATLIYRLKNIVKQEGNAL